MAGEPGRESLARLPSGTQTCTSQHTCGSESRPAGLTFPCALDTLQQGPRRSRGASGVEVGRKPPEKRSRAPHLQSSRKDLAENPKPHSSAERHNTGRRPPEDQVRRCTPAPTRSPQTEHQDVMEVAPRSGRPRMGPGSASQKSRTRPSSPRSRRPRGAPRGAPGKQEPGRKSGRSSTKVGTYLKAVSRALFLP